MRRLIAAVTLSLIAVPAGAVTYDAFSTFTGTSTGGAFTYGVLNDTLATPTFTPYSDTPGCAGLISSTICTSDGYLPAAFKSTDGAHQSGTVIVPGNALILHPGPNAGESSAIVFTAPVSSTYLVSFSAMTADTTPSGITFEYFVPGQFVAPLSTIAYANTIVSGSNIVYGYLTKGSQFGFAVNYDGSYFNDSTAVNFSTTAVPEPASWALTIGGFGLLGAVARRRRGALAA